MSQESIQNDDERLVAYLDGELDDGQSVQVEQLLASKPEIRHQVERLARTWDLLDLLPASRASQEFSHRTLTAVRNSSSASTVRENDDDGVSTKINLKSLPQRRDDQWKRIGLRVLAFVGLALVGAIGFRSTHDTGNQVSDEDLRNYPVIRRFDEYRDVRNPSFLKELHDSRMFSKPE